MKRFKPAGVSKTCANIPDSKSCYFALSQSIHGIIFSADAPLLAAPVFHICQTKAPTCHSEIWSEIIDDIKIENLWIYSAANFSPKSGMFVMELNMIDNFLRGLRENIVKKEVTSELPAVRTAALQLISKIDKKIIYLQDYSKNNLVDEEALAFKKALQQAKIKK
ncbi:MAG: hypothetical protein H7235_07005 [Bdellovibrionaceae bacterium]|nr:hypothetical protein [Pseudobdellovibrionaceae bacterium]